MDGQGSSSDALEQNSAGQELAAELERASLVEPLANDAHEGMHCGKDVVEPPQLDSEASEANDMTCAICLEQIPPVDFASIKGCDHVYCVHCILRWAAQREDMRCPQCKSPFTALVSHRRLDGSVSDYPLEESVCLLKRARWFELYLQEAEQGKALLSESHFRRADDGDRDWDDYLAAQLDEEYLEAEEEEAYYFSSAAGRARVVLGNRRWGEGGYVAGGRTYARPAPPPHTSQGKATRLAQKAFAGGGSSSGAASSSASPATPAAARVARGSSPASASKGKGKSPMGPSPAASSSSEQGRRARRNARRAAQDSRGVLCSP